jgi:hypothetical protein
MWAKAELGMTYRAIEQTSGLGFAAIRKMVEKPDYEPFYSDGVRFLRWHRKMLREARIPLVGSSRKLGGEVKD